MTKSKKIAYSGVGATIGIVMIAASRFFPSIIFYIIASIALYVVLQKCGWLYSLLSFLVVCLAGIAISIQTTIPYMVLIAPHVYLSYTLNRVLKIKKPVLYYAVRGAIVATLFCVGFVGIYFLASTAMVNIPKLEDLMGLPILIIAGAIVFAVYDIACTNITLYVAKQLK